MHLMSQGIRSRFQDLCKRFAENCNDTETQSQQGALMCGKKTTRLKRVAGNCIEGLKIQQEKTRLDYHNLQVTEYGYVEKVFTNFGHKLNRSENDDV